MIMTILHLANENYDLFILETRPSVFGPVEHWKCSNRKRVFSEARPGRKGLPVLERRGDSTSEQRREIT